MRFKGLDSSLRILSITVLKENIISVKTFDMATYNKTCQTWLSEPIQIRSLTTFWATREKKEIEGH